MSFFPSVLSQLIWFSYYFFCLEFWVLFLSASTTTKLLPFFSVFQTLLYFLFLFFLYSHLFFCLLQYSSYLLSLWNLLLLLKLYPFLTSVTLTFFLNQQMFFSTGPVGKLRKQWWPNTFPILLALLVLLFISLSLALYKPTLPFPMVINIPIASAIIFMMITSKSTLPYRPDISLKFQVSVSNCLLVVSTWVSQSTLYLAPNALPGTSQLFNKDV